MKIYADELKLESGKNVAVYISLLQRKHVLLKLLCFSFGFNEPMKHQRPSEVDGHWSFCVY